MLTSSPPATLSDGDPAKDERIAPANATSIEAQKIVRWLYYFFATSFRLLFTVFPFFSLGTPCHFRIWFSIGII